MGRVHVGVCVCVCTQTLLFEILQTIYNILACHSDVHNYLSHSSSLSILIYNMLAYHIDVHNCLSRSSSLSILTQRMRLDRRRLEDAHFQYAILKVASWYNLKLSFMELQMVHFSSWVAFTIRFS